METKKKKLLLKKETVATLNDRSLHGIQGGTDIEEDGIESWHTCGAGTCTVIPDLRTKIPPCTLETKFDKTQCIQCSVMTCPQ